MFYAGGCCLIMQAALTLGQKKLLINLHHMGDTDFYEILNLLIRYIIIT